MRAMSGKTREVRVRTARLEDAGAIADLSGQLGYPSSAASVRRRLRDLLGKPDHAIWVAENSGGSVAGWIHVFVHALLESDRQAEIGGLVIDENFRGHGAGKALVGRAERWAKSRRLVSVYARSNIIRKEAHAFYQKLGYKIIKTQHAFRKELC
ncbi:MAG TPA: GNAT family N-acetyltransferase [Terriglobia bacterium]|nr:GNAT family N-acetyltransferase [Terriglobia bacterium]